MLQTALWRSPVQYMPISLFLSPSRHREVRKFHFDREPREWCKRGFIVLDVTRIHLSLGWCINVNSAALTYPRYSMASITNVSCWNRAPLIVRREYGNWTSLFINEKLMSAGQRATLHKPRLRKISSRCTISHCGVSKCPRICHASSVIVLFILAVKQIL